MSRLASSKVSVSTAEVLQSSDPAARLADYSGTQYYYIPGRSSVSAELASSSLPVLEAEFSNQNLQSEDGDSPSERDLCSTVPSTGKEQKTDHVAKVKLTMFLFMMQVSVSD